MPRNIKRNKRQTKRNNKRKNLKGGSCKMNYVSNYRTPCSALPLDSEFLFSKNQYQNGGNAPVEANNNSNANANVNANVNTVVNRVPVACTSYNVDVNQPMVAGRAVIVGNPPGCQESQMCSLNSFQNGGAYGSSGSGGLGGAPIQKGSGAACAGYGFNLSDQIADQPAVVLNAPNCTYGETAGGGKKKRAKGKSRRKASGSKKNKTLESAISSFCKRQAKKGKRCSKSMKKKMYNTVQKNICKQ
tara:strand:- start:587 stop:1321 length:735 start_codon:yes stop_codon:yes gene_type:complete